MRTSVRSAQRSGFMMRSMISAAVLTAATIAGAAPALAQYPAQAVAYSVEPFTPPSQITINGAGVRLRAEPFTNPPAQVLSSGSTGLPLNVIGIARRPDWNWYQVILKSGQKAFIRSDYTSAPSRGAGTAVAAAPTVIAPVAPTAPATSQPYAAAPAPAPLPSATRIENSPASSPFASTPAYTGATPTASAPIAIAPSAPASLPATPVVTTPVVTAPAPYTPAPYASTPVPVAPAAPLPSGNQAASGAPISLTPRSAAPAIPVPAPTEPSYPGGLQSKPPG